MRRGTLRSGTTAPLAPVVSLTQARIERALLHRTRYRYVHPRVLAEGAGWKVVCANCSRNVDPDGGEIDIAWLQPGAAGTWILHARDHGRGAWVARGDGLQLDAALQLLCADAAREYWR